MNEKVDKRILKEVKLNQWNLHTKKSCRRVVYI